VDNEEVEVYSYHPLWEMECAPLALDWLVGAACGFLEQNWGRGISCRADGVAVRESGRKSRPPSRQVDKVIHKSAGFSTAFP
jgi:hypothetical protein